jgi:glycosyltransferase involved in cell wall biosynthesis
VPELLPFVRRRYRRGPLISHTVWETDALPPTWPGLLDRTDRVIVPTEWNRAVFEADGVRTPVSVVPHVVCDPVPGDGGVPMRLPDDVVVFYTIGRWDERKQPGAVIRAFCDAFSADDPVALVVKTSALSQFPAPGMWGNSTQLGGTTMLEVARIMREHRRPPLVRVEIDDWTPSRIAGLHTRGDCYVSLTHGEGWGLGAFDATAYGNPVVMTDWGGSGEFLDPELAYLVSADVEPVTYWDRNVYGPGQQWAVPRHEHAVELLREVAGDLEAARGRAASLRTRVQREYAPARVAECMRAAAPELAEVARECDEAFAATSTGSEWASPPLGDHP